MALLSGGGKLSGKSRSIVTTRRPKTRESGFKVKAGNTGVLYKTDKSVSAYELSPDHPVRITFSIPQDIDIFSGFGLWYAVDTNEPSEIKIRQIAGEKHRLTNKLFERPNWSKLGSMWLGDSEQPETITFEFTAIASTRFYVYQALAGTVSEPQLDIAPPALTKNMYSFAPEALFILEEGTIKIEGKEITSTKEITLKNCNRCGRYLPINTANEQQHLSFSNHCTAAHKVPCQHTTFSKLKKPGESEPSLILRNGFQLECRFCKKFRVNAALNPQRTVGQMREDGQRRRAIELLVNKAIGRSPVVQYRKEHDGRELSDDIWEKFDKKCFKCKTPLKLNQVNLDHTRPLSLLWPLDSTATALCKDCNTDKRAKMPSEFYTENELQELAYITGLSLEELKSGHPNVEVLDLLWRRREWIFSVFFEDPNFAKIHQGKDTRHLIVKALDKASQRAPKEHRYSFTEAYDAFRRNKN